MTATTPPAQASDEPMRAALPPMPKEECLLVGVYAHRSSTMAKYGAACFAAGQADTPRATVDVERDDEDRSAWTFKQWYEHVGAWETPEGFVSFGSPMAVRAMLIQYARAALKAQPAPTEAQVRPDFSKFATIEEWQVAMSKWSLNAALGKEPTEAQANTCKKCSSSNSNPVAAQGEDSARLEWKRITAPGQVKVGDSLRLTIGDEKFSERVKQIINPGYPDEELIYNKRRNFYVITSNAITNFGSSKNVEFLAWASAETGGVKS